MSRQPQIKNRLTRLGLHCFLLGSFAVFGGAARGFNLLLVLSAFLIGTMLVHWRWSRKNVTEVSLQRRTPTETFAGQIVRIRVRLSNRSRWLPKWMLRFEDQIEHGMEHQTERATGAIVSIAAMGTESADYRCRLTRRGRYRFGPLQLQSTFPFSLFQCQASFDQYDEIRVLPQPLELRRNWRQRLSARPENAARAATSSGSNEGEFFGLRPWRNGDSRKSIHWRTSARMNEPVVRQVEQKRRFDLCVLVDAHAEEDGDASLAETAIRLVATMISESTRSATNQIVMATTASNQTTVIRGNSESDRHEMLCMLADLDTRQPTDVAGAIERLAQRTDSTQRMIVISNRSQDRSVSSGSPTTRGPASIERSADLLWINLQEGTDDLIATANSFAAHQGMAQHSFDPELPANPDIASGRLGVMEQKTT